MLRDDLCIALVDYLRCTLRDHLNIDPIGTQNMESLSFNAQHELHLKKIYNDVNSHIGAM